MQLICKVNQAMAIRRGFNPSSTVKIEVDIPSLSEAQRDLIAAHFRNGELTVEIPQPDLAGLMEILDGMIAHEIERKEYAEKQNREQIERAFERLRQRLTTSCFRSLSVCRDANGEIVEGYKKHSVEVEYKEVSSDIRGFTAEIYEHPDYKAWSAELDAQNAAAKLAAFKEACELLIKKEAAQAIASAKLADLKLWAKTNGSMALKYLIEEDLSWQDKAKDEWVAALAIAPMVLGYKDHKATSWEDCTEPADSEIVALARVRASLAEKAPGSTAKLETITYEDGGETWQKNLICASILIMGQWKIEKYFVAE